MTLARLSYDELKNLIGYFERNPSLASLADPNRYSVTTHKLPFSSDLVFKITFPKSYVRELAMEKAIELVLEGQYEEIQE
jgi:hypothetical protein